jgi:hypothetical protein
MSSDFFIERYSREKHQAFLSEAAKGRLAHDARAAQHRLWRETLRVRTALLMAAIGALARQAPHPAWRTSEH